MYRPSHRPSFLWYIFSPLRICLSLSDGLFDGKKYISIRYKFQLEPKIKLLNILKIKLKYFLSLIFH